jgi:hypothetical protein
MILVELVSEHAFPDRTLTLDARNVGDTKQGGAILSDGF